MLALHRLHSALVDSNPCMIQGVACEDTWEQRMTLDGRRARTPRINGQVHVDGTWLLERHTRLDLERPSATSPVGGGGAAGRGRRTRDERADLFDTRDRQGVTLLVVRPHPDDESIATGGMLASYSARGVRTGG